MLSVVPGAIVGLGTTPAEAAVPCFTPPQSLDYHCYISCIGTCSDTYSACNSDPYQSSNTIVCVNGGFSGTPAQAVAKCDTSHPHSIGYGCCVYC